MPLLLLYIVTSSLLLFIGASGVQPRPYHPDDPRGLLLPITKPDSEPQPSPPPPQPSTYESLLSDFEQPHLQREDDSVQGGGEERKEEEKEEEVFGDTNGLSEEHFEIHRRRRRGNLPPRNWIATAQERGLLIKKKPTTDDEALPNTMSDDEFIRTSLYHELHPKNTLEEKKNSPFQRALQEKLPATRVAVVPEDLMQKERDAHNKLEEVFLRHSNDLAPMVFLTHESLESHAYHVDEVLERLKRDYAEDLQVLLTAHDVASVSEWRQKLLEEYHKSF